MVSNKPMQEKQLSVLLVSVGEVMLGPFVEHSFGFEYWNYTGIPFHITKYTSVPTATGFGVLITLFMGRGFENIMTHIHNMPNRIVKTAGIILMGLIVADFIVCFTIMYRNCSLNVKWVKSFCSGKK